jgi:two-component system, cell cycle sensor histidine kinase and response regulator CckA
VVDDEPAVRTVAARILERGGYVVHQAADGREALAEIARSGVPALVLTDLMMPVMSGRQLADALHAQFPKLPVIFMSGYSSSALAGVGDVARHELLIEKPFTATSLLALVSTLVSLQAH